MANKLVSKWAFDVSTNPPLFCEHEFHDNGDTIVHTIGGDVRAMVPKGHIGDYLMTPAVSQAITDDEKVAILDNCHDAIVEMLKKAGENPDV